MSTQLVPAPSPRVVASDWTMPVKGDAMLNGAITNHAVTLIARYAPRTSCSSRLASPADRQSKKATDRAEPTDGESDMRGERERPQTAFMSRAYGHRREPGQMQDEETG